MKCKQCTRIVHSPHQVICGYCYVETGNYLQECSERLSSLDETEYIREAIRIIKESPDFVSGYYLCYSPDTLRFNLKFDNGMKFVFLRVGENVIYSRVK